MNTDCLPTDLRDVTPSEGILIYDYNSAINVDKSKITLQRNVISLVTNGQKEVYFPGMALRVSEKQAIIMPASNCLMTEGISTEKNYYRSILLFFDNNQVQAFVQKYIRYFNHAPSGRAVEQSPFLLENDAFLGVYKASLAQLLQLSGQISSEIYQVKFEEIMLYLLLKHGAPFVEFILSMLHNDNHITFKNCIEKHQYSNLTLDELAFINNMSLATFKRHFQKTYHCAPQKWLMERRMEKAGYLLKVEAKRPTEIYQELGYEDLSSFTYAFKRHYGTPPSTYLAKM